MTRANRAVVVAGVVAVFAGLASVATRGSLAAFDLSYAFVTLVGLLALVQGLRRAAERWSTAVFGADAGEPERRYRVPAPGDEFDARLAEARARSVRGTRTRGEVRARLREAAVDALVLHGNYDPESAEERVETGAWTDDPFAAAFLGDEAPRPPVSAKLRELFRRGSRFERDVHRTLAAVEALQGRGRARGRGRDPSRDRRRRADR
ncbi:DUF7269 family protein [Halegenticoccus soli]|uniref:DUF7269 family protein n=1 Tax=Halegenticoccus soli TaxID=1985678 RepID=UPI000C6D014A|nr:hypothetical protein [Halegenticoccus soli]